MKCFNHAQTDAAGICKVCGKGICQACTIPREFAVCCSEACAIEAGELREMMQRGKRVYAVGGRGKRVATQPILMAVVGLFFLLAGIAFSFVTAPLAYFMGSAGLLFIGLGWFSYRRMKSLDINV